MQKQESVATDTTDINFSIFYQQMAPGIFKYLLRMCHHRHLAEELLQETFLAIYRNIDTYDADKASAKTWAFTIATNKFRDHQRKHKEKEGNSELLEIETCPGPNPEISICLKQDAQMLREAVLALPPKLRATLLLVRFEGLKYREAAEVLGVSLGTVRMQMHRSMEMLKEKLGDAGSE